MTPCRSPDLQERIEHRRAQCRRARAPLALLHIQLLDVSGWRDRCGEAAARGLVAEMGQRLRRGVRDTDEVLAQGADFALLLPGAGRTEAETVRRRLLAVLCAPYRLGPWLLTPSVHIAGNLWSNEACVGSADRAVALA